MPRPPALLDCDGQYKVLSLDAGMATPVSSTVTATEPSCCPVAMQDRPILADALLGIEHHLVNLVPHGHDRLNRPVLNMQPHDPPSPDRGHHFVRSRELRRKRFKRKLAHQRH